MKGIAIIAIVALFAASHVSEDDSNGSENMVV